MGCWTADFHFTIRYRPAKVNVDADFTIQNASWYRNSNERIYRGVFIRMCGSHYTSCGGSARPRSTSLTLVCQCAPVRKEIGDEPYKSLSKEEQAQRDDTNVKEIIDHLQSESRPSSKQWRSANPTVRGLMRERDKLVLDEYGILPRKASQWMQLVLPAQFKSIVLRELHDEMGHQGLDRTTSFIRDCFFWPYMKRISNTMCWESVHA